MRNEDDYFYNYFSLSPGLFLKFYNNKRPLKKTKLFRILIIKYLRKLLIASEIRDLVIIVRKGPIMFLELFDILMTPDNKPYMLPNSKEVYNDELLNTRFPKLFVRKFFFTKTKFFGVFKGPRKGRLKRKVFRKLIKKANVMD